MSAIIKSKEFLMVLIIASSFFCYLPYFVDVPQPIPQIESWFVSTIVVTASFAVLVSLYTITRREGMKIIKRGRGWPYGMIVLAIAWLMIIFGGIYGQNDPTYRFLANGFILPGDAAIYAILVFYLTSTAARSFKVKNLDSLVLFLGAALVLLQQAPLGEFLMPWISPMGVWAVQDLAMAASRVFTITATLGGIVLAIRLLAGKEMALVGLIARRVKGDDK